MMSESQVMMKFEFLPNEILIELFEYFTIFDVFYSFNQLNTHLNELIRTIPLHLNFKNIEKLTFDRFCKFFLLYPEIKTQVYSLELSNKNTYGQIKAFLSYFSLNEFYNLHSLTLIQIGKNSFQKLKTILPLLSQLHSFHLIDSNNIIFNIPLTPNLRILSIPTFYSIDNKLSSIINLTISGCSIDQLLQQLFKYIPMLTYLNIKSLSEYYNSIINYSNVNTYKAVHLREFILYNFEYKFQDFKILAKHIPKLTSLKFYGNYDLDMINANQWEDLITSSLPCLEIFKFAFTYIYKNPDNNLSDKFNKFQNDFWIKQHQWYTEYSLSNTCVFIYTIPYIFNSYKLELNSIRYWNQFLNTFNNIKNLTLYHTIINESCQYYFSNIKSLTILSSEELSRPTLEIQTIKLLKTIVNLSNINFLSISLKFRIKDALILFKILQEFPKLSSLMINIRILERFTYNKELCDYLNKIILNLNIYKYHSYSFKSHYQIEEFCKIFSNLKQLKCNINQTNDLLYLLNHLPKLINLKIYLWSINNHEYFYSWFKRHTQKLNLLFQIKYIDKYETELSIWISRNID